MYEYDVMIMELKDRHLNLQIVFEIFPEKIIKIPITLQFSLALVKHSLCSTPIMLVKVIQTPLMKKVNI